jgi:hypothetical protein
MGTAIVSNRAKLDAWRAYILQITSVKIRLFTNNLTPTNTNVLADFTEASYPGYAEASWVLAAPTIVAPDSKARLTPFAAVFQCPTSGSDVDIYGVFVAYQDISATFRVLMSRRLPSAPLTLVVGADPVTFLNYLNWWDPDHP